MKTILKTSTLGLGIMFVVGLVSLSALSHSKRTIVESETRMELKEMGTNLGFGESDVELPSDIILVTVN